MRSEQIPQRPQDANSPRAVSSQILRSEAAASGYLPISQLGQIVDDDDATCDAPNRGVYQYVEVKEHRMLLSQRREMPQLHTKIPEGLDTPRGFVAFNGAPDKI